LLREARIRDQLDDLVSKFPVSLRRTGCVASFFEPTVDRLVEVHTCLCAKDIVPRLQRPLRVSRPVREGTLSRVAKRAILQVFSHFHGWFSAYARVRLDKDRTHSQIDYLVRALRRGACIAYDPALTVIHDERPLSPPLGYRDGASFGYILRK